MTSIAPHPGNRPALATVLALAVLVAGAALVVLADRASVARAEADAASRLRAELGARRERVVDYLEDVGSDMQSIASSRISGTIVGEFVDALAADGDDAYANVRRAYVLDNPNPPGRRQALLEAGDGSLYSEVHSRYHDWLLSFASAHDYYDLFLVDADGRVVYSVFKEDDFGTSLVDGDYSDTALAATFERLGDERAPDRAAFSDFVEYAPSDGLPAAFVGSAIRRDGRFAGALLAQLKQSRIAELVAGERTGALDARTYVFGADGRLRTGSGVPARTVLRTAYDGPGAKAALANRSGVVGDERVRRRRRRRRVRAAPLERGVLGHRRRARSRRRAPPGGRAAPHARPRPRPRHAPRVRRRLAAGRAARAGGGAAGRALSPSDGAGGLSP